jgi:polyphosphate kinase
MLADQLLLDDDWKDTQTKTNVADLLAMVLRKTKRLVARFNDAYQEVRKDVEKMGPQQITAKTRLEKKDEDYLKSIFKYKIAPEIIPFIVEKKHPLPFLENDSLVVAATLRTKNGNNRFGFLPIPDNVDKVYRLPSDPNRFIIVDELVKKFADRVFHKFTVEGKLIFSIVRNADIDESDGLYDYDPDFAETMSKIIEARAFRAPVMLKYHTTDETPKLLNYLGKNLALRKSQLLHFESPLDFRYLGDINDLIPDKFRKKASYPAHTPALNPALDENGDIIEQILQKDILMSYPFESISGMVTLIKQAAKDDRVSAISMTLYRASKKSQIVAGLSSAAKHGKKVNCVVELRARFDEENNIDHSEKLKKSGVNVVYGLPDYKVHSKLLLIELTDGRKIALIGTGNFNESTAQFYTDVALMTANPAITDDVKAVFDNTEASTFVQTSNELLVSPLLMKPKLLELIEHEIEKAKVGEPARIIMKMNSLTEKEMMEKLVEASKAGVKIDLVVRGISCLVAGIPHETENIKIRSIVGRYLEHSRIFAFGAGKNEPIRYFISSADLMSRNLTGRVEVATPVYDNLAKKKLQTILDLCLKDNLNARIQKPSGKYVPAKIKKLSRKIDSQAELAEQATKTAKK